MRVDEAGAVRSACARFGGHVLLGDRFAGDPVPLLPFGGAGWLVVGVQEQAVHSGQRPFCLASRIRTLRSSRGWFLPTSFGPVVGLGGVVRGRRAEDQTVSDDLRPAEPGHPGAVVTVAEDPPVLAVGVELAVVPGGDPGLRLVLVAVAGPLVGELPQVVVQGREGPGRCCSPVVVRPSPDDRVDLREDGRRVGAP